MEADARVRAARAEEIEANPPDLKHLAPESPPLCSTSHLARGSQDLSFSNIASTRDVSFSTYLPTFTYG